MAFCQKCGTQIQDGISACPNCGAFVNIGINSSMGSQFYLKPHIPGRGLGISGMVLGIIGLFLGFCFLMISVDFVNNAPSDIRDEDFFGVLAIYSVLSILGVSLGGAGRSKGYRNGVSTTGIITGIIGILVYLISIIVSTTA